MICSTWASSMIQQRCLVLAVAHSDRRLAEVRANGMHRIAEAEAQLLEAVHRSSEAAWRAQCCEVAAECPAAKSTGR